MAKYCRHGGHAWDIHRRTGYIYIIIYNYYRLGRVGRYDDIFTGKTKSIFPETLNYLPEFRTAKTNTTTIVMIYACRPPNPGIWVCLQMSSRYGKIYPDYMPEIYMEILGRQITRCSIL